jgi:hypothetical protein
MGVRPTAKATVAADTKSATRLVVIEIPPARDGPDWPDLMVELRVQQRAFDKIPALRTTVSKEKLHQLQIARVKRPRIFED